MRRKQAPRPGRNAQTTAGQQESRDRGSAGDFPGSAGDPAPPPAKGAAGRQAYDRSGKTSRDFKRSGQIHSDTQDRI